MTFWLYVVAFLLGCMVLTMIGDMLRTLLDWAAAHDSKKQAKAEANARQKRAEAEALAQVEEERREREDEEGDRLEREEHQRRQQVQERECQQQQEEKRRASLANRVRKLKCMVELHGNILNPTHRQNYVGKFWSHILTHSAPIWRKEYTDLKANTVLFETLQKHSPEVLAWHEARLSMILAAEQIEAQPPRPVVAPKPFNDHKAHNYRRRRQRENIARSVDLEADKVETIDKTIRQRVQRMDYLEADEKTRLTRELTLKMKHQQQGGSNNHDRAESL